MLECSCCLSPFPCAPFFRSAIVVFSRRTLFSYLLLLLLSESAAILIAVDVLLSICSESMCSDMLCDVLLSMCSCRSLSCNEVVRTTPPKLQPTNVLLCFQSVLYQRLRLKTCWKCRRLRRVQLLYRPLLVGGSNRSDRCGGYRARTQSKRGGSTCGQFPGGLICRTSRGTISHSRSPILSTAHFPNLISRMLGGSSVTPTNITYSNFLLDFISLVC